MERNIGTHYLRHLLFVDVPIHTQSASNKRALSAFTDGKTCMRRHRFPYRFSSNTVFDLVLCLFVSHIRQAVCMLLVHYALISREDSAQFQQVILCCELGSDIKHLGTSCRSRFPPVSAGYLPNLRANRGLIHLFGPFLGSSC